MMQSGEKEKQEKSKIGLKHLPFNDHFTLSNPSSTLKLKNKESKVFILGNSQIVLEQENDSDQVIAKQIDAGSAGLFLIRAAYSLVAFLMSGFLFVFCIQLILFLFLGLAIESGLTSSDEEFTFLVFVGTLFAIPAYLFGMANAMTLAMAFITDVWNGQKFLKTILKWDSVLVDWVSTSVFLFVPFLVGAGYLFAAVDDWWDKTLIAWFTCVFIYFLVFAAVTIYHEIDGCFQLIRYSRNRDKSFDNINGRFSLEILKAAMLMKMKNKLGGKAYVDTTVCGKLDCETVDTSQGQEENRPSSIQYLPMSRLTLLFVGCSLYKSVYKRLHTIDDVSGHTPFVTNSTWGLDTIYCRNRKTRYITVVKGESALTHKQVISSFFCYLIGLAFTLIMFVAFMVWFELPKGAIGVLCGAYVIWCYWSVRNSAALKSLYDKVVTQKTDTDESEVLYQVRERFKVTEPKDNVCWVVLFLEFLLFFVCPVGSLFHAGNVPVGSLFIFVSIITMTRRYCNSTVALEEFGTLDGIEADNEKTGEDQEAKEEDWREKHRLGLIMRDISSGRKNDFWLSVFAFFILAFCGLFMIAVWKGADSGLNEGWTYTSKFQYPGSGNLEYTSCTIGQNIVPPDTTETSLSDFTFLAGVAYESPDITSGSLENWFNHNGTDTGKTIDHENLLQQWRSQYEQENGKSAVTYKFLGFPKSNVGVVTIRGTSNGWDALSDAQLWSAASLAQWIRALMPLGEVFTPVLTYLVEVVSAIESQHLDKVAFYKQTSAFVNYVKNLNEGDEGYYENIIVTGHSLGGGLAMISGAQQKVPSIALSGPNAMISRRTFDPPITPIDLERYTFNIVPDRDVVPRLDDLSQNYQRINCRSGLNDPLSCHFGIRSMCEVLMTCGSRGRPIPCHCLDLEDIYSTSLVPSATNVGETLADVCVE